MKKKTVKIVLIIIAAAAAVIGAMFYFLMPDELEVVAADTGTVSPKLVMTGNVEGDDDVTVYADIGGKVTARHVNTGDRVSKGDILLSYTGEAQKRAVDVAETNVEYEQKIIDSINSSREENQKKVAAANAKISQCEVVYATLKSNILALDSGNYAKDYDRQRQKQVMENDILKMQDEVASQQSELAKLEVDLKKAELLEEKKDVSGLIEEVKDIQDKISETNTAISKNQRAIVCLPIEGMDPATYETYQKLQNDLETVTRLWGEARTERDTAQSMVRAYDDILGNEQRMALDELSLDQAKDELEKAGSGCTAPTDGVIIKCYVDDGAMVEKGTPVFEMQKVDGYRVKLLVSKYDITDVKEGQSADISIGGTAYQGQVSEISQYAEADPSGKSKAVVYLDLPTQETLIVGMEADVTINLAEAQNAVMVPNECLYADDSGSYIYTVDKGRTVVKTYVQTGVKDGTNTQILSGIEAGEHIVYDPTAADHEGEKIREKI